MIDPGPGDRFAHREDSRAQEPEVDPVHPHAPRPFARRRRDQGGDRRADPRPPGARGPGRDLQARRRAGERPAHRPRRDLRCARSTRPGTRRTTSATCSRRRSMLFTGDHVMQGSTVVINPPDGDMRAYLASLERLLRRGHRDHRAGPRLPDRRAAPRGAPPDRASPRRASARWSRRSSSSSIRRSRRCCRWSTTTCPSASTASRRARSPRTSTSWSPKARCALEESRYTLVESAELESLEARR